MTPLDALKLFYDALTSVSEQTEQTGTVDSCEVNQMVDAALVGGADNAWRWGMVTFTSGNAENVSRVLTASAGTTLTWSDPIPTDWLPAAGDGYKVWSGYLPGAEVYIHDPQAASADYTVVLHIPSSAKARRTLGRSESKVLTNQIRVGAVCEAPYGVALGDANERVQQEAIYLFGEQVADILAYTRYQSSAQAWGTGPLRLRYGFTGRAGQTEERRAVNIEFDFSAVT